MRRFFFLALVCAIVWTDMMYRQPPTYYAVVMRRDGSVIASPLDASAIEFTSTCFVPGASQQDVGSFVIHLRDTEHDPTARHLRPVYEQLDYQQYVKIYDRADCMGTPVFSGVITEMPDDLNSAQVRGLGILHELEKRRVRRHHMIRDNAGAAVEQLLKTYNVVFKDDFNRDSIGNNWSFTVGDWIISGNALKNINKIGDPTINTAATYTSAQWSCARLALDVNADDLSSDRVPFIFFVGTYLSADPGYILALINYNAQETQMQINGLRAGSVISELRAVTYEFDQWNHIEIFTQDEGGRLRIIVTLNGNEVFNLLDNIGSADGGFGFFVGDGGTGNLGALFDNVVFSVATNALTRGTFESTAVTVEQMFNADTQMDVIRWLANRCGNWLYRVNPQAGIGADTFDFASDIGRDLSDVIVLEAGKNIVDLQRNRTSDGMATSLLLTGQAQDDASAAFVANALGAFDTYGVIEAIESDERVVDAATAREIAEWRLATMSGNVSISGTIIDESALFQQTPLIGYAHIGDFIIGGRAQLREGDQVWLKWDNKKIDRRVRIVSITRRSGDPSTQVVFDYFPWRRMDEMKRLRERLSALTRAYLNRRNSRNFHFEFSSNGAQTRHFYVVGNIVNTRIDIMLTSGTPIYKVYLDGNDRTLALFGTATLTTTAHAIDTTYLNLAGEHSIGIEVVSGSPAAFDVEVQPGILS